MSRYRVHRSVYYGGRLGNSFILDTQTGELVRGKGNRLRSFKEAKTAEREATKLNACTALAMGDRPYGETRGEK